MLSYFYRQNQSFQSLVPSMEGEKKKIALETMHWIFQTQAPASLFNHTKIKVLKQVVVISNTFVPIFSHVLVYPSADWDLPFTKSICASTCKQSIIQLKHCESMLTPQGKK